MSSREVVRGQIDVLRDAACGLEIGERLLEAVPVDAVHDLAVHLDQPAVGVEREARVRRSRRRALRPCHVVQAEVEDRVHHPGHRDRRARANRDEQRLRRRRRSACPSAPRGAAMCSSTSSSSPSGTCPPRGHVRAARVGRDREAGGDGHAELRSSRRGRPPCRRGARDRRWRPRRSRRHSAFAGGIYPYRSESGNPHGCVLAEVVYAAESRTGVPPV